MQPGSKIIWTIITGLALLTLGCQSLLDIELPSFAQSVVLDEDWPKSTFVHPASRVQTFPGHPLTIETYHLSTEPLTAIKILINGQPLRSEETAGAGAFPVGRLNVQVQTETGDLVQTDRVTPPLPTTKQTVTLLVVGNTPGCYDLSLVATDEAGREGTPVVQRIDVIDR